MNLSLSQLSPMFPSSLTWHILLETLEEGQIKAWIAEFPECKVVAESQKAAIAALEVLLNKRMETIQVIPLQVEFKHSENPLFKLYGLFKESASFAEWSDRFWAEKQQGSEDDPELSVEDSMRVM